MKNWRFLIQQEGDRDWLPLESPESDILEGRYRLVGQSPLTHHPVRVHLSYRDLDTAAVRHRSHETQTNSKGLVGIFPFSRLEPGLWDVVCHVGSDSVTLRLQVDPQDGAPEPELVPDLSRLNSAYGAAESIPGAAVGATGHSGAPTDTDDPTETDAPPKPPASASPAASAEEAIASVANLFQTAEAMADQVISTLSEQLTADKPAADVPTGRAVPPRSPATALPSAAATIQLHASAYSVQVDHPLALKGHILGPSDFAGLPGILTLMLITPKTGEIIAQHTYPYPVVQLPSSFDWSVPVSLANQTQLLLARLSLRSSASPDQQWPLIECSFAVMVLPSRAEPARPEIRIPTPAAGLPSPSIPKPTGLDGLSSGDDIVNPFQYPG